MRWNDPAQAEPSTAEIAPDLPIPFVEFVALTALLMALTALSIDIMLPALPAIGESLGVIRENDRQLVVILHMVGFAFGQLIYGPVSDRIGRRPALLVGLGIFITGTLIASAATTFAGLLAARMIQGLGSASPRVLTISVIRDVCSGRQMGRVMSLTMMVFIVVPMLAPSVGQAVTQFGSWRWAFYVLLLVGLLASAWTALRLPETGKAALGREGMPTFTHSLKATVLNPQTMAYGVAAGFMTSALLAYIASAQQIFVEVYHLGAMFPLAFGALASAQGIASFLNSRIVGRLGLRRVAHTALVAYCAVALLFALVAALGVAVLPVFVALVAILFFLFVLIVPNFTALAMEPQGRNAGMASSVIGALSTGIGAVIGGSVGRAFDGTPLPLALGFAGCSLATLAIVALAEGRGGLFGRT